MITINNQEEIEPYYNEKINTYLFNDDVDFKCNIVVYSGIFANDIKAWDINARNIKSRNINAWDIKASDDINALDINAWDIRAGDINAWDINASDINAMNINANNISFYSVCFARETFVCNAIRGRRENSKYFCLDSDVVIKNKKG